MEQEPARFPQGVRFQRTLFRPGERLYLVNFSTRMRLLMREQETRRERIAKLRRLLRDFPRAENRDFRLVKTSAPTGGEKSSSTGRED